MPVRVLGCSGAIADHCRTTSFLVNDHVLIDAGTGVGDLTVDEMTGIDHVLLTHSHLDHIAALPLLADTVMRRRRQQGRAPIRIWALPQTLDALRQHIFNNVIWPDFTRLPDEHQPVLSLHTLEVGQQLEFDGVGAEVLPASHTVPAVGYALWTSGTADSGQRGCWVFTGDTGPNPALWSRLRQLNVQQLVIETAFADTDAHLAELSGHLHPQSLAAELAQWDRTRGQVFVTHVKPGEEKAISSALQVLGLLHQVQLLQAGDLLPLGDSGGPSWVPAFVASARKATV